MSTLDVAERATRPLLEYNLGPFPDMAAALEAQHDQGLIDAEAIGYPSGRWWLTPRDRARKCGDCWATTWSSTGFCTQHLIARNYQLPPAPIDRRLRALAPARPGGNSGLGSTALTAEGMHAAPTGPIAFPARPATALAQTSPE